MILIPLNYQEIWGGEDGTAPTAVFLNSGAPGHMTQAAEILHIAQPSLSRSIALLEQEVGVPLFERTGRRIHLNQYGEVLLRRVEFILNDVERAKREITDLQGAAQELVALSVSPSCSTYLLPRLLSRFRARYPEIRFQSRPPTRTRHMADSRSSKRWKRAGRTVSLPPGAEGASATEWRQC